MNLSFFYFANGTEIVAPNITLTYVRLVSNYCRNRNASALHSVHLHFDKGKKNLRAPSRMAPKRHSIGDNMEHVVYRNDVHQSMQLPYSDNWIWSKRHRSQEVMLSDSTYRKGNRTIVNKCKCNYCRRFIHILPFCLCLHHPFIFPSNVPC